MQRRLALTSLFALAANARATGLGATDIGFLDGLNIDERTHAATLLLIIDRPLEDGLTKPRVRGKLLAYHDWTYVDKKLTKYHPEVNLASGVGLLLLYPEPKAALGRSVLEQLVGYARELQFQPVAKPLPTKG